MTILAHINASCIIRSVSVWLFFFVLITQCIHTGMADELQFEHTSLVIRTANGDVTFQVEVAATPQTRRQGLMFREHLGLTEGMLFDYHESKNVAMWMKNTLIPLDMLFITGEGVVVRIETGTEPLSLRPIPSGVPVRAVLELSGGAVEAFAIRPGDRVIHEMFGTDGMETVTGTARIVDGDTLWVDGTKIRLYNIDAPELEQKCRDADDALYPCGRLSRHELSLLTSGQEVRCIVNDRDRDGVRSGTCFVGVMNLSKEMVARGWAVVYRMKKYDEDYMRAALVARNSRRGMWRGDFVMPWDWRKGGG